MSKGELDLLVQILDEEVPVQEIKAWLDDAFEGGHESKKAQNNNGNSSRFSKKFENCDPLAFVVTMLNFLREDTAPLLAPSCERSQTAEHPSQACTAVKEGGPDTCTDGRDLPPTPPDLLPTTTFDISSVDDFPSLSLGEASRGNRAVTKQKRRIRPTPLSNADKPMEGDITGFGSAGTARPAVVGEREIAVTSKVRAQGVSPSFQARKPPQGRAFQGVTTMDPIIRHKARIDRPKGTEPSTDLAKDLEGFGENGGIVHLREATCGSSPERDRVARRHPVHRKEEGNGLTGPVSKEKTCSMTLSSVDPGSGDFSGIQRAGEPGTDLSHSQERILSRVATSELSSAASSGQEISDCLMRTPEKPGLAGSKLQTGSRTVSGNGPTLTPVVMPRTPARTTADKERRRGNDRPLTVLASLYVHVMVRRFVPSLATEMHLTIRLLHLRPGVERCVDDKRGLEMEREGNPPPSSSLRTTVTPALTNSLLKQDDNCLGVHKKPKRKVVFNTGLDCRSFAASVLLGLKSLLPHIGSDTVDLLAESLVFASQSEKLLGEVRHVLCEAKGDNVKADGSGPRTVAQQNADDTAIVQSVGAPFAALQWREEDSLKNFRTTSDRNLFQNRQESVDRFGSLLRNYQGSRKGLQQYPELALQDLRTAASTLISGLAPENLAWFAQYFLGQLVGWGLAPPEETDSEVMALVAPAGDKGRATLQKLHRRISSPSYGEDGSALKSSQKLRHPREKSRPAHVEKARGSTVVGGSGGSKVGAQPPRPRKPTPGPRHGKGQTPVMVRVPLAPLQLHWFPGNQEFFYHVLVVMDSYTFNSHLKVELAAEISRLYRQQTTRNTSRKGADHVNDIAGASPISKSAAGQCRGFTGTMVKLKVLAKFLGLLTFSPNWGVSTSNEWLSTNKEGHGTSCPLPLDAYLDHACLTAGLVGAVPWMVDFLRMMKWDGISAQAGFYRHILGALAELHSQPRMRPGHPGFTESLLAVSCEVESLFQDLGSDLGVHGYRLSSSNKPLDLDPLETCKTRAEKSTLLSSMNVIGVSGSLDEEVVLSRRFIHNCCPYLEDILTLVENLSRAWKFGLGSGGNGNTPLRAGPSPRTIVTGTSPRSRRVIKPHPLKPIRVMSSLPEQHRRGEGAGEHTVTGRGSAYTESARLRLVEAFFHSLPDDVQVTADFVVRRAVQNACEEVLAGVVRPAVSAAVGKLHSTFNRANKVKHPSSASSSLLVSTSGGVRSHRDEGQRIDQVMASLGRNLQSKARSLAGKRGNAVAAATSLSLVPKSISLRVRQTVAVIAGHHAQQAAERKIGEMFVTTVTEAVSSYPIGQATTSQAAMLLDPSTEREGSTRTRQSQEVIEGLVTKAPASKLLLLASTFADAAHKLVPGFRQEIIVEAARRLSISRVKDIQALKDVVDETFRLVNAVRHGKNYHNTKEELNCGPRGEGAVFGSRHGRESNDQDTPTNEPQSRGMTQYVGMVRIFLSSLGGLYWELPDHHHHIWQSFRSLSSGVTSNAFEDLVHLAAIAWEADNLPSLEAVLPGSMECDTTGHCSGFHARFSQEGRLAKGNCCRCFPWDPLLSLMSWGVVPVLTAENVLLSLIQTATNPEVGEENVGHSQGSYRGIASSSRRDGVVAVAIAVAKGYHSLAVGEDLSTVSLTDLLSVASNSFVTRSATSKALVLYHPLNFCRIVTRLTMVFVG